MLDKKPAFDVQAIRSEFPILEQKIHDKPLVYLDSAASAQSLRRFWIACMLPMPKPMPMCIAAFICCPNSQQTNMKLSGTRPQGF